MYPAHMVRRHQRERERERRRIEQERDRAQDRLALEDAYEQAFLSLHPGSFPRARYARGWYEVWQGRTRPANPKRYRERDFIDTVRRLRAEKAVKDAEKA